MSCRTVRGWLHLDVDSLDEAQRLILDDHLAACEPCRGDRGRMRLLHRIGTALQAPPPHAREYSRAIARALLEGSTRTISAPAPARRWALPVTLAATAAAAAAIVVVWIATRGEAPRAGGETATSAPPPLGPPRAGDLEARAPAPPAPSPAPAPADLVEDGALRAGTATIAAGAEVPASTLLRATTPARLRLASARVVVAAGAELRWLSVERTILLERGSLDVEAAPDGVTRIATARFEVEAEGASLTVDPAAVRVHRGAARVVDRKRALLAQLDQGGAWTPPEPATRPGRPSFPARPARPDAPPTASRWLAEARARFAARDHGAAERAAEAALESAPSRTEAAEARTLLADIAQASGALELAVTRYVTVATRFADLPAAESALYAAARLELRRARRAEARALLTRYLDRYPAGRYTDDVRRQLASIP